VATKKKKITQREKREKMEELGIVLGPTCDPEKHKLKKAGRSEPSSENNKQRIGKKEGQRSPKGGFGKRIEEIRAGLKRGQVATRSLNRRISQGRSAWGEVAAREREDAAKTRRGRVRSNGFKGKPNQNGGGLRR